MVDRVLPGLGLQTVVGSVKVNRRALTDTDFRRWVSSRVYRHLCCDWGAVPVGVAEENFASVVLGGPLLSRWPFEEDALLIVHDDVHEQVSVVFESEKAVEISNPTHMEA